MPAHMPAQVATEAKTVPTLNFTRAPNPRHQAIPCPLQDVMPTLLAQTYPITEISRPEKPDHLCLVTPVLGSFGPMIPESRYSQSLSHTT